MKLLRNSDTIKLVTSIVFCVIVVYIHVHISKFLFTIDFECSEFFYIISIVSLNALLHFETSTAFFRLPQYAYM